MISAGNDIVDLSSVDVERSMNSRFYSKFITASELALYQQTAAVIMPLATYVWLLWSVKESVYKYLKRHQTDLVFSPGKIIVTHIHFPVKPLDISLTEHPWENTAETNGLYSGTVTFGEVTLFFNAIVQPAFAASIVNNTADFESLKWGIANITDNGNEAQSAAVRALVIGKLEQMYPADLFNIQKNKYQIPVVHQNGIETDILVSLAHHNHYISYCLRLK